MVRIQRKVVFIAQPVITASSKCIDYIEKWSFMVIFLYNLYSLPSSFQFYYIQSHVISNNSVNISSSFLNQCLINHRSLASADDQPQKLCRVQPLQWILKVNMVCYCFCGLTSEGDAAENTHCDGTADVTGKEADIEEEEEFDWSIEQTPYTEQASPLDAPRYGFASQKSGVFQRLQVGYFTNWDYGKATICLVSSFVCC